MDNYSRATAVLSEIYKEYPPGLREVQKRDIPRVAFNLSLVLERIGEGGAVCDLGGGVGLFSVGCAALGLSSTVVDDFNDPINRTTGESIFRIHDKYGVQVVKRDVVKDGLPFSPSSIDVITSFDSMEHWHQSPKKLFRQVVDALKPGGRLILNAPNGVCLHKRVFVPLGRSNWSRMEDWYEPEIFRGHVREPCVKDFKYIASDLKLQNVKILGRNWLGYYVQNDTFKSINKIIDPTLRAFPSLCTDLYMIGEKSASASP